MVLCDVISAVIEFMARAFQLPRAVGVQDVTVVEIQPYASV
jgi:hypothetical protein